jgi:Fe-S cluster biogenesis protein NfuA
MLDAAHAHQEVAMKDRVEQVINRIRPAVQMDGGDIQLVDIVDGLVRVRLSGACHGCPSSMMTLKMGIERAIRAEVPEITGVEAIEDNA